MEWMSSFNFRLMALASLFRVFWISEGGEIDINDQDKNKSTGVLYPAAQLIINSDGELQIELRKNPWRLSNIIVRGKGAE